MAMNPLASVLVGGVDRTALRERLRQARVRLNPLAEQLFVDARFVTAATPSTVHVVAVSVCDLGFLRGATFEQLVCAAAQRGLSVCPLELGPHLRLKWLDQPEVEAPADVPTGTAPPGAVTVASVAPADHADVPWGFYLRRIGGEPWLRGYRSWSGHVWPPQDVLAFARRHNAP